MKKLGGEFLQSRAFKIGVLGCLVVSMMICTAFAEEGSSSAINTAFQTGFQQVVSDSLSLIAIIVPIALGLAGTIFVVKKAMSWFKGMAK